MIYYSVKCPRCGALKGHPCHNKDGVLVAVAHEARKRAWREKEGKFQ